MLATYGNYVQHKARTIATTASSVVALKSLGINGERET